MHCAVDAESNRPKPRNDVRINLITIAGEISSTTTKILLLRFVISAKMACSLTKEFRRKLIHGDLLTLTEAAG